MGHVRQKTPIPPELQAQCDEINKQWLNGIVRPKAVPVLTPSDWGDEWRIELHDSKGFPLMRHIQPSQASGHVLLLCVTAIEEAYLRGIKEGTKRSALRMLNLVCDTVKITPHEVMEGMKRD